MTTAGTGYEDWTEANLLIEQERLISAGSSSAMTLLATFAAAGGNLTRVLEECQTRHIRVRYWDEAGGRIRVSTHIFTQQTELNAFFDAVERGLRG